MTAIGGIVWPGLTALVNDAPSITSFAISASNSAIEFLCQAPEGSGVTITAIGVNPQTKTGTQPTYRVSIQGVSAGHADGTIKGGGSPCSQTFTTTGFGTSTWNWVTLANSYAAAPGEVFCIVIDYSSGTIGASNNTAFYAGAASGFGYSLPCAIQNSAGTRTAITGLPLFGFQTASASYGYPFAAGGTTTWNSGSSPNEYAMSFTLPAGSVSTYTVRGMLASLNVLSTSAAFSLKLYSGTTVLQNTSFAAGSFGQVAAQKHFRLAFQDSPLATLQAGTQYRLSLVPDANNLVWRNITVDLAASWGGWPGGSQFGSSNRNGGAWTDTATVRYVADLIVDDFTVPLLSRRGFTGGFEG
ncbi:hypothetical protein BH11PLA2_BH11PLA2_34690 [soil metagenome]